MILNNNLYDILKWIGRVVLPALAVLYGTLGKTWGLPFIEQIPTTIMAIDLFLNTILGIASENYSKKEG